MLHFVLQYFEHLFLYFLNVIGNQKIVYHDNIFATERITDIFGGDDKVTAASADTVRFLHSGNADDRNVGKQPFNLLFQQLRNANTIAAQNADFHLCVGTLYCPNNINGQIADLIFRQFHLQAMSQQHTGGPCNRIYIRIFLFYLGKQRIGNVNAIAQFFHRGTQVEK